MTQFDHNHIIVAKFADGSGYMTVSAALDDENATTVQNFFTDLMPGDTVQIMTLDEYRAGAWKLGVAA